MFCVERLALSLFGIVFCFCLRLLRVHGEASDANRPQAIESSDDVGSARDPI
jgi:hypothetical protein